MQPVKPLEFKFRFVQNRQAQGLGHLHGKDGNGGVGYVTRSLRSCANYVPSLQLIYRLQQAAQTNNAQKKS